MAYLSIEIVYHDNDLVEVLTRATNGRYSGTTTVYIDENDLIDLGNQLKGFPRSIDQIEEKEFGFTKKSQEAFQKLKVIRPQTKPATAYLSLKFYCIDRIGHPAVHVTLQEDLWSERAEANGKASFEISFEPAQLDKFAEELIELGKNKDGTAILQGIHDDKDTFV